MVGPARYRIRLMGRVDTFWADRLGGLRITGEEPAAVGTVVTTLAGYLQDQAALAGVLNWIYDMGLTLLSVERLEDEGGEAGFS